MTSNDMEQRSHGKWVLGRGRHVFFVPGPPAASTLVIPLLTCRLSLAYYYGWNPICSLFLESLLQTALSGVQRKSLLRVVSGDLVNPVDTN